MWASWLKHGSGQSTNKSSERIVLSFNTFFKEEVTYEYRN